MDDDPTLSSPANAGGADKRINVAANRIPTDDTVVVDDELNTVRKP